LALGRIQSFRKTGKVARGDLPGALKDKLLHVVAGSLQRKRKRSQGGEKREGMGKYSRNRKGEMET